MTTLRHNNELTFTTHDGENLFYRHWPASGDRQGTIVLFHRGHEHSARLAHIVDELNLPDYEFFAWDARGHGNSPGERGYSPSFGTSVRDVQTFVDHICQHHDQNINNMTILGQSVGAVLVSTWVHDYAPKIRAMILASPAFKVKLYVPFARTGLKLMQQLKGNFFVNSYVKSKFLTHDKTRQDSYDSDPLIARAISVNILLGLYEAAERVVSDAQAITVPTQLLVSDADWVVHKAPQYEFFSKLGSKVKEVHSLSGFYHDTLGEKDRSIALDKIRHFILERYTHKFELPTLTEAHKYGATYDESITISAPLTPLTPKSLYWQSVRCGLKISGWFSAGIKLGHQTGFDSGSTLDFVYRNTPSSKSWLGNFIDKQYLSSLGWRGIRQRKIHLEELIQKTIKQLQNDDKEVRILDIAAGHGRYVLDAIEPTKQNIHSICLRDYSDINVNDGGALIRSRGLEDIAKFEKANAFDKAAIAEIQPKPTLAIVSGLYELFPNNDLLKDSLAGLAQATEPGSYLLYTGQPWHPQLEFIARALTSHREGDAWVMRRRTQQEMDQLVEAAGFTKLEQRIDEWGIFTVSVAVRN